MAIDPIVGATIYPAFDRFSRLPTGAKLGLIIAAALLPLALIAMAASLQITRITDADTRARLNVAALESARVIAADLTGDVAALSTAVDALSENSGDEPSCARLHGVFARQETVGAHFVVMDRQRRVLCGGLPMPTAPARPHEGLTSTILVGQGVLLTFKGAQGVTARAFYPAALLTGVVRGAMPSPFYGRVLSDGESSLVVATRSERSRFDRVQTVGVDLGIDSLSLITSGRSVPLDWSLAVALLVPLLMWLAASATAWFVADRLLIRPLRHLRANVAAYQPGEIIDPGIVRAMQALEIRELGETFQSISRTVADHEAGLADGLVRQTKLTREVHHRVKNNLQVISSLINLHARGAATGAAAAYSTIQRRVDALAVVHRNHFAESEEKRGLNLRVMIGELAANIRATAPERSAGPQITLDMEPVLVNQDVAVAVAFLMTETIELAMTCDPAAQIRLAAAMNDTGDRATLRVVSRSLIDGENLRVLVEKRYGRVMEGLARQLRSTLHHDPLVGAYEITIAVLGRD